MIERQIKKVAARPAPDGATPSTPLANNGAYDDQHAEDAAAVLMAVDEDDEVGEEAQVPEAFDYFSDPEDADDA